MIPRSTTWTGALAAALTLVLGLALPGPAGAVEPTPVTVDVLFLYTPDVTARYGSGVDARIDQIVAVANDAFRRSEGGMRLRAVHSEEVGYGSSADSGTALEDLTYNRGVFAGTETLRDQVGADMVTLLRPYVGDGTCGVAWVGGYRSGGNLSGSRRYAYSHVSIDCSDYVLGHELGHNLGLTHSRRQDGQGGTYPWSLGHGVNGSFVTMMAYGSAFSRAPKVHVFSTPNLTCSGVPCGIAKSNSANGADAADTLRAVASQVAAYRPTVVPASGAPSLDVLGPNRNSLLDPGAAYPISWSHSGLSSVDLAYRVEGESAFVPIAQGVTGTQHAWTVPVGLAGLSIRILADGLGSSGTTLVSDLSEVAQVDQAAAPPTVNKNKKKKKKKKKKKRKKKKKKKRKKKSKK